MLPTDDTSGEVRAGKGSPVLLCRVGPLVCGLPARLVSETLRPLPLEPLNGMPPFVDGLSIIRGAPVPVVDLARLLGKESGARRSRLVVMKMNERRIALAVDLVIGMGSVPSSAAALPSLLGQASAELVAAIGSLDTRLLVILETGLILTASAWEAFDQRGDAT
jgi:purine-binding chemotaxis protein CheW